MNAFALPTVKGTLLRGIEFEGELHRDFEMRPLLVRDSQRALLAMGAVAGKDESLLDCHLRAAQLVSLGSIPKEKITGEMLLDLLDDDMATLYKAHEDLQKKIREPKSKGESKKSAG